MSEHDRQAGLRRSCLKGILDAVLMLREAIETSSDLRRTMTVDITQLHKALNEVETLLATQPNTAIEWYDLWRNLQIATGTLLDIARPLPKRELRRRIAKSWHGPVQCTPM
jgi:hypothetical protein